MESRWLTNRELYKPQINRGERETEREASYNNKRCVVSLFSVVVFTLAQSSGVIWGEEERQKDRQSTERPKLANNCQEAACLLQC